MNNDKMTEKESLALIANMINKAKGGVNDNGIGALLWGTAVSLAGFIGFIKFQFRLDLYGFDPWLLCALALFPQIYLNIKERNEKKLVKQYDTELLDAVWGVYGFSIFMLVAYFNIIGFATKGIFSSEAKIVILKDIATGKITENFYVTYSSLSLLMLLFCIPTLITGIGKKVKLMLIGGVLNVIFYVISLFVDTQWDNLLAGFTGFFNWFIPGLVMRKKFLTARKAGDKHV